jgi:hypothetical protein
MPTVSGESAFRIPDPDVSPLLAGIVIRVSQVGLLVHSIKNLPVGTKLNIGVRFPNGFALTHFESAHRGCPEGLQWKKDWEEMRMRIEIRSQARKRLQETAATSG